MSCTNCGSAFHEKWACPKPAANQAPFVIETIGSVSPGGATSSSPYPDVAIVGKRRGRPQTITDMKAYKRDKERARRAAKAQTVTNIQN